MKLEYQPIGIIHSPFSDPAAMPIQPSGARGTRGTVEIYPEYADGLKDLDGFSHLILLYHFHLNRGFSLQVVPFLDTEKRGLFATRAPRRPNPIGLSVVRLTGVEGCTLQVENLDMLDGTPVLDIKPYVPLFDEQSDVRTGWLEASGTAVHEKESDGRFAGTAGRDAEDSER